MPETQQAKSGDSHHPWRRLLAKSVDVYTIGLLPLVAAFLLAATIMQIFPFSSEAEIQVAAQVAFGLPMTLLFAPIDAAFLAVFGGTPGRWLYGISVRAENGGKLSFRRAMRRSFQLGFQGMGMFTYAGLITYALSYQRLAEAGTTRWDTASGAVVSHAAWGRWRWLLVVVVTAMALLLGALLFAAFEGMSRN